MADLQKQVLDLKIERPRATQARVKWTAVPNTSTYVIMLNDPLVCNAEWMFFCGAEQTVFELPMRLVCGHTYRVILRAQKVVSQGSKVFYKTIRQAAVNFRAEFTKMELRELLDRAIEAVTEERTQAVDSITWLYRNKPTEYFDHIQKNCNGVMEVYLKDQNGDPGSLINGKLHGLFFATNVDRKTQQPPMTSHFGEVRLYLPAAQIFTADSAHLYFADFYCNYQAHYVTLVYTNLNTNADKFCRENLIKLDIYKNAFLYKSHSDTLCVTRNVHVEVLYTENVDIPKWIAEYGAKMGNVVMSTGTSTPGGLPKNPSCKVCNIHPAGLSTFEELN